jgi:uncharacterized protein YukE
VSDGGGGGVPTLEGLPWPEGDAGALKSAAKTVHTCAQALGEASSSLAAHTRGPAGWRGPAASAFRDTIAAETGAMDRSAAALAEASPALRHLAETVQDSQNEVVDLAAAVREAEAAATAATARAALAATVEIGVSVATGGDPDFREMRREADQASDRANSSAATARTHAAEVRSRAMRRTEQICDGLHSVDVATARAVDRAAALAPMGGAPMPWRRRRRRRSARRSSRT